MLDSSARQLSSERPLCEMVFQCLQAWNRWYSREGAGTLSCSVCCNQNMMFYGSNRWFSKSVSKFQHIFCLQKCTWWASRFVQLCVILSNQTNIFKISWPWRWRHSHPSAPGCCCTRRSRSRGPSRPGSARNASRSTDRTARPRPPPALWNRKQKESVHLQHRDTPDTPDTHLTHLTQLCFSPTSIQVMFCHKLNDPLIYCSNYFSTI